MNASAAMAGGDSRIDVLVPVASRAPYVEAALASAAAQTVRGSLYLVENAIGDAGYSEELQLLATRYGANYVRFDERLPMAANWQRCMTIGNSPCVAFLHDDDIWPAHFLERCTSALQSSDIVFHTYRYFSGTAPLSAAISLHRLVRESCREDLLARMINSYHHASATVFRRSLGVHFPGNFKMVLDQYGFRLGVAKNPSAAVSWVETEDAVLIRQHEAQGTWAAYAYSEKENAICHLAFIDHIRHETLDRKRLAQQIANRYPPVSLSKMIGTIAKRANDRFGILLAAEILCSRPSLRLAGMSLARLLLQDTVWQLKLLRQRFRSA